MYTELFIAKIEQAKNIISFLGFRPTAAALERVLEALGAAPLESWTKAFLAEVAADLEEVGCPYAG